VIPVGSQRPNNWQGLNADLRVSDDGKMAVKHIDGTPSNTSDFQDFYATPPVLAQSAQALATTGSAFSIAQGTDTLVGIPPNSLWSRLWGQTQTLYKAEISNQDLDRSGKGDYTFNACSANMLNFLGVVRTLDDDPEQLDRRRDVLLKLRGSFNFVRREINLGDDLNRAMIEARKIVTGASSDRARQAYNDLGSSMRKWVSWRFGINENALPEVGEGWGIYRGGEGGKIGYGHFVPVIARSGEDRVTLENDVGQDENLEPTSIGPINPDWYMRMFGAVKRHWFSANEDQTFYGEALRFEQKDYGDNPLVVRLGSTPRT
jgi:hypothetical protein